MKTTQEAQPECKAADPWICEWSDCPVHGEPRPGNPVPLYASGVLHVCTPAGMRVATPTEIGGHVSLWQRVVPTPRAANAPTHTGHTCDTSSALTGIDQVAYDLRCAACVSMRIAVEGPMLPVSPRSAAEWLYQLTHTSVGITAKEHNAALVLSRALQDPAWRGPRPETARPTHETPAIGATVQVKNGLRGTIRSIKLGVNIEATERMPAGFAEWFIEDLVPLDEKTIIGKDGNG